MVLSVDSRVGSKELAAPLRKLGLPVEMETLEFGDVAWIGRGEHDAPVTVGLEFKQLNELVGAFRSERLQGYQAPGMAQSYDVRYLLIEGVLQTNDRGLLIRRKSAYEFTPLEGHMTVNEYRKRLATLYVQYGLIRLNTATRKETLGEIEALYHFWTDKSLDEHRSHMAIYRPPSLAPITDFMRIVSALPGVGYELARRLETQFRTPMAFFQASDAEWTAIKGIGAKTASQMRVCLFEGGAP